MAHIARNVVHSAVAKVEVEHVAAAACDRQLARRLERGRERGLLHSGGTKVDGLPASWVDERLAVESKAVPCRLCKLWVRFDGGREGTMPCRGQVGAGARCASNLARCPAVAAWCGISCQEARPSQQPIAAAPPARGAAAGEAGLRGAFAPAHTCVGEQRGGGSGVLVTADLAAASHHLHPAEPGQRGGRTGGACGTVLPARRWPWVPRHSGLHVTWSLQKQLKEAHALGGATAGRAAGPSCARLGRGRAGWLPAWLAQCHCQASSSRAVLAALTSRSAPI